MSRHSLGGRGSVRDWSMRTKATAIFVGVLLVVGLTGTVAMGRVASQALRAQVQTQFGIAAKDMLQSMTDIAMRQLSSLRAVSIDQDVRQGCAQANVDRTGMQGDALWEAAREWDSASGDSEAVRLIIDPRTNAVTAQLTAYAASLPIAGEMLVTDAKGVLVAATSRPAAYIQANTAWWQATYADGLGGSYVGISYSDGSSTGLPMLEIAVPVYDGSTEDRSIVGVIYRKTDVPALTRSSELRPAQQALMSTARGQVLAVSDPGLTDATMDLGWLDDGDPAVGNRSAYEAEALDGTSVLVGRALMLELDLEPGVESDALGDLDWEVSVYEPAVSAYRGATVVVLMIWALGLGTLAVIGTGAYLLVRPVYAPVERLVEFAGQVETGAEIERALVYPHREAAALARALNVLLDDVESLRAEGEERDILEEQRKERPQDYARLIADIADAASAAATLEDVAQRSVQLVQEHLRLYFVGLYIVDSAALWAVLHTGTGEEGRALLARGHRVAVGAGTVGRCVASGRARVENDLGVLPDRVNGELLPYGKSEVAVPLRSRGLVLGAISAQSYQSGTFDDEFLMAFQTVAVCVAAAIDTFRLSGTSSEASSRFQRASGEMSRAAWRNMLGGDVGRGFEARRTGVKRLSAASPDAWETDLQQVWRTNQPTGRQLEGEGGVLTHHFALPIRSRDEVIGVLDVSKLSDDGDWTSVEIQQLVGLADEVSQALENARLYEAAQRSELQEQSVGDVTRRIRETLSVDTVLQTALYELRTLLDLEAVEIRIGQTAEALSADHTSGGGVG